MVSRTGYTGEPLCFEIFTSSKKLEFLWETILSEGEKEGIVPAGLGARDSLRLEAGLVLYGNELGLDPEGKEIPIYAMLPAARVAVSFSSLKGEFIGRQALRAQFEEVNARENGYPVPPKEKRLVPRSIMPFLVTGQGIARRGHEVFVEGKSAGRGDERNDGSLLGFSARTESLPVPTDERRMRPIGLAYLDSDLKEGQKIEIRYRGRALEGLIVERKSISRGAALCPSSFSRGGAVKEARKKRLERPRFTTDRSSGPEHPLETERGLQPDPFRTDPLPFSQGFFDDGPLRPIR